MGVVYKARDTRLDRFVALKFLPSHLNASEQDKTRFIQEARAASALNHPNVCTIHDIQEHDGRMFIVMEFVEGQTLQEKKNGLSFKQMIDIGIQIAEGLASAHEKGIVHRDIKPENIMIRRDGIAQIMDFGLAKLQGVSRLTKEGSTIGTAGYMSPEQVQGLEADHRSDIFSLGVVLFELFTGQLPFKGVHETALMYEIVNVDVPPMSSIKPEIDPALDAIVLECLEKDPNERAQSARQIAIDLKKLRRESGGRRVTRIVAATPVMRSGTSPPARSGRRLLWPVVSGVCILGLGVALWMLRKESTSERPIERLSISLLKDQSVETSNYVAIAVSPDGSCIVYRAGGKLYQRNLDKFALEEIPGTDDGSNPFFSPDGMSIGFFAGGKLKKIALRGGVPVTLADVPTDPRGGTWLKDGTLVFAGSTTGLFRVNAEGGDVAAVTTLDTLHNERSHRWPEGLPDGKTVIFTIGSMDSPDYYEDATIGAVNTKTGERKVILRGASTARYVPAGCLTYSRSGSLFAAPFDLNHLEVTGPSIPVVNGLSGDQTTGAMNYAVSENGTLLWIPGQAVSGNRELIFADLAGRFSILPLPPGHYLEPHESPDGRSVALVLGSGKDYDVWVYSIPNNTTNRLTFGGSNRSPVWSPDGKRIAYSCNPADKPSIIIKEADGTGAAEEIPMDRRSYVNCWSRDGSTLLLSMAVPGSGWNLYTLPLHGDRRIHPLQTTKDDELQATLSPDGRWFSYVDRSSGTGRVFVRPFPNGDGKWQVSSGEGREAHWSPDGRTLYYADAQAITAVPIENSRSFVMGQPHVVLSDFTWMSLESATTFDVAPDGKHILITRAKEGDDTPRQINVVLNWFEELRKNVLAGK